MGSLSVAVIVVVFERCAGVGGTWLYDDKVSTNHHSSLYASLRTNLPRETMGFLDFPLVSSDSGDSRRFPGHAEVLRYLQEFARRFDLHGMVKLQTEVLSVRREASSSWKVTYSRKQEEKEVIVEEEVFDAVVVCNGHFTHPRLADIAGIDGWPGKQMHSHSYRVADPFHGQVVVVIGYKPSGMDISRDIAGVAKEVHVAIRSPAAAAANISQTQQMPLPANQAHPNLWLHSCTVERAEGDGSVVFQDGSRVKADAIVHCTGYKYSFPFLDEDDAGINVDDNRVGPLYKHVFPPRLAPHISFIGLPFRAMLFPVFQLQSNWVAGVLSGRIELPSQEEMMKDVAAFYSDLEARGCPKRYTHDLGTSFEYEDWLAERSGLDKIEEWRKAVYLAARKNVTDRPEAYRDDDRSLRYDATGCV